MRYPKCHSKTQLGPGVATLGNSMPQLEAAVTEPGYLHMWFSVFGQHEPARAVARSRRTHLRPRSTRLSMESELQLAKRTTSLPRSTKWWYQKLIWYSQYHVLSNLACCRSVMHGFGPPWLTAIAGRDTPVPTNPQTHHVPFDSCELNSVVTKM